MHGHCFRKGYGVCLIGTYPFSSCWLFNWLWELRCEFCLCIYAKIRELKEYYLCPWTVKDYAFRCICCSTNTVFGNYRTIFCRVNHTYLCIARVIRCRNSPRKLLEIFNYKQSRKQNLSSKLKRNRFSVNENHVLPFGVWDKQG